MWGWRVAKGHYSNDNVLGIGLVVFRINKFFTLRSSGREYISDVFGFLGCAGGLVCPPRIPYGLHWTPYGLSAKSTHIIVGLMPIYGNN